MHAEAPDEPVGASLLGGLAFRSVADGRQHGVAAVVTADSPSYGPVAVRLDGLALYIPGSTRDEPGDVSEDLALPAAALSLTWRFDESDIRAHMGVGPFVGVALDGDAASLTVGGLASLGLRFPVLRGVDAEARVLVPLPVYTQGNVVTPGAWALADGTAVSWPLQAAAVVGVHIDPFALLDDSKTAPLERGDAATIESPGEFP